MTNKITSSDHDLLVRLTVRVEDMARDLKEIKDNTQSTLGSHDLRLRKLEDSHLSVQPEKNLVKFYQLLGEWEDFKSRWKVYALLGGTVLAIIISILTEFIRRFFLP